MYRTVLLLGPVLVLALACSQGPVQTGEYKATLLMLPEGNPQSGREAFLALGCTACHAVAWDSGLPAPTASATGPELGLDVAQLGTGGLATSIVAPSHRVAKEYQARTPGNVSPMADYSATLTIRQLADIVAYLERQGQETHALTGQLAPGS